MIKYFLICLCLGLMSCKLGYFNENKQYVPKRPAFTLKDKLNGVFPAMLDTTNVYKMARYYFDGKQEYPYLESDPRYNDRAYNFGVQYLKFYSERRCLSFAASDTLKETDLNPNRQSVGKDYYYSSDGRKIQHECFLYGQGYGTYAKFNMVINNGGDTLTAYGERSTQIYIRVQIPETWKKYGADW